MCKKNTVHINNEQQIKENKNTIKVLLVVIGKSLSNASQSILQAIDLIAEIQKIILEDM
ncbi:hypothetical protein [Clostridium butyricum]|uniref:hypothetical protein n=1 Tax=Clostridium butyricum TaxID=1492 RepID=UPI000AD4ECC6|nr:hypothetical protein [Clostridium butyricum]QUF81990.1 hypothetical protein KDJ93_09585 [Clostridium butyricum]